MVAFLDCLLPLMGSIPMSGERACTHFQSILRDHFQFKPLGSGHFSTVYSIMIGDCVRVIKITSQRPDEGALMVAKTAYELRLAGVVDPIMPVVYAFRDFGEGWCVSEIEKLSEPNSPYTATEIITGGGTVPLSAHINGGSPFISALDKAQDEWLLAGNMDRDIFWDIHGGNVMQRADGQVVLTDPIAVLRSYDPTYDHRGAGQRRGMGKSIPRDMRPEPVAKDANHLRSILDGEVANELHKQMMAMMAKPVNVRDFLPLDALPVRKARAIGIMDNFVPFRKTGWMQQAIPVLNAFDTEQHGFIQDNDPAHRRPLNKHDPKPPRHHDHLLNRNDRRIVGGKGW